MNSAGTYAGYFDTLIAGVLAADPAVAATLSGNGQHAVFAPTDDAFARLGLDENLEPTLPTVLAEAPFIIQAGSASQFSASVRW